MWVMCSLTCHRLCRLPTPKGKHSESQIRLNYFFLWRERAREQLETTQLICGYIPAETHEVCLESKT